MSESYVHACERAELLGLPTPSEEEWKESQRSQAENHANDENDDTVAQNLDSSDEAAQRIGGGLDELNSILNATQKKINRFKTVCGSLGTLLKVKVGSRNNTPDHKTVERSNDEETAVKEDVPADEEEGITSELPDDSYDPDGTKNSESTPKKIDINQKMGSHLDKLDSLINKAENAQYSMQHQTKQMKKFLK